MVEWIHAPDMGVSHICIGTRPEGNSYVCLICQAGNERIAVE